MDILTEVSSARISTAIAAAILMPGAPAAHAWADTPAAPAASVAAASYDGFKRTSRYITSADGTRIAIDIYQPTRNGVVATEKLPVIFTQSRSVERAALKSNPKFDLIERFTAAGYVWVSQDRRGTGASYGVQKGFVNRDDRMDGKAVVEWAAAQAWSSGKAGSTGCSNQGAHQYTLAAEAPKGLTAIAPECATPTFFDTTQSVNGVSSYAMGMAPTYDGSCDQPTKPGEPVDEDKGPQFAMATAAGLEHKCNAKFLGQYWANMYRDSMHPLLKYKPGMVDSAAMQSDAVRASGIKILNVGGWFDASPAGAVLAWQLWGGRVVIGPWKHAEVGAPNASFANAKLDRAALYIKWSDYTLKGKANGFDSEPPIAYYTINAPRDQEWRYAAQWPLPNVQPTRFYFAEGGTGTVKSLNDGLLSTSAPTGDGADSYKPDYSASLFDGTYMMLYRHWEGDMRTSTDQKGLTYTMPALESELQITGNPLINIWVTSTAKDEDFFAVLEDVSADGKSTFVTDGRIRASRGKVAKAPWGDTGLPYHPQLEGEDRPLSAETPSELAFDFLPTSYVFKKGHHVRVSIINSGGPSFQAPAGQDRTTPPTIRVLRGARYPSSITLPIIPPASSLYGGQLSIDTPKVRYSGPGFLYASPNGTYLKYGEKWLPFGAASKSTKSGYSAKGETGVIVVGLSRAPSGERSATVAGSGIKFSGTGRDVPN